MADKPEFRVVDTITIDDDGVVHLPKATFDEGQGGLKRVVDLEKLGNTASGDSIIYAAGEIQAMRRGSSVKVVHTPQQDFVQVGSTQWPVPAEWANGYEALIARNGKHVGLTKKRDGSGYVRKPSESFKLLPEAVRNTIGNDDDNRGYYLKPEYCAQR